ncbi:MAG: O-antigen ligase family protein, partial [Bacteroidota bacterium]
MGYIVVFFFLINSKAFLGSSVALKFLPTFVLLLGVVKYYRVRKASFTFRPPTFTSRTWIYILFLLFFNISLARTAYPNATPVGLLNDTLAIIMIFLVAYGHVTSQFRTEVNFDDVYTRETLRMLLVPSVIIALFLLFYAVGYNHPSTKLRRQGEDMVILGALGIKLAKKAIPFTGQHPNLIGVWAGATFIMTFLGYITLKNITPKVRRLLLINTAIIGFFLLLADSRGTVFSTVMTTAIVFLTYKFRMQGVLRVFTIIVPIMPFVFVTMMATFADSALFSTFARSGGTQNLTTLSARTVIWEECLKEIRDLDTPHIFGWGEHGQSTAGVSKNYRDIFPPDSYENDLIVTHNMFFQAFFDIGYVGAL